MELTNEQWNRIEPIIVSLTPIKDPRGRKPRDPREVMNGILWILRTGAPWADLPERYPPKSTCHRRFQEWTESGVFAKILTALAQDLKERGGIDLSEGFIDGTFAPAKKGAMVWAKPKRVKEPKLWALQTLLVFLSPLTHPMLTRMK